MNIISLLAIG